MKQKLLNSFKLRATLLVAILCSLFTGTAWGDDVLNEPFNISGTNQVASTYNGWSVTRCWGADGSIRLGASSGDKGQLITPALSSLSGNATLTFEVKRYSTDTGSIGITVSAGAGSVSGDVSVASSSISAENWTTKTVSITGGSSTTQIKFLMTNKRMYLRNVRIVAESGGSTTYTVTYDGNGATSGDVPEDDNEYEEDDEVTVLGNTGSLAKTGYAFSGWNTQNDGQGTNYTAGNTFAISANTTLYAKWTPYTITAQSNNPSYGTVTLNGYVITASPEEGYTYAATAYTVSSGTATVAQDGNTFTVTPSSDCTVTINFAAIPTHTLSSAVSPVGAGSVTLGSASVWEGGTTTATAAANEGYKFTSWSISGTGASLSSTSTNPTTVTMGTANATITANFEAVVTHKVNWSVNGIITTDNVEEGAAITFPDDPADVNGKTFVGWYTAEYTHATDAPAFVNSAKMGNADVTYYAVFATVDAGDPTVVTLSNSTITSNATGKGSYSNDYNIENWTGRYMINNNSSVYSLQLGYNSDSSKSAYNSHLTTPNCVDNIQSITIETQNNTANGRKFFLCSADNLGTASISDATYGNGSLSEANGSVTINVTGNTKQLHIYPDGTAYIKTISLTSQSVSISDYTTDARAEAGIAFANASVDAQLTSGYTGQALTNANSVSPITYSSSDETVATINTSSGVITGLLKAGSTNITASFAGNATYKAAVASYTLNVTEKTPAGLTYAVTEVAKSYGDENFTNALSNPNNLDGVTYGSSNTGVATVDEDGEVTIKTVGSTTITASFAGDATYDAGNASYTLTVSKATPMLNFAALNATLREGKDFEGNTLTTTPGDLAVTYSSSETSVATVDSFTGAPTFVAAGSTTITATFAGNDTYTSANASYTLKVLAAPTISVNDDDVDFDETYTVNTDGFTGGAVTVISENTAIATVAGLVITPAAVGTVTITVSTAETETYDAGSATFDLTINAPTGNTKAEQTVFNETFAECTSTGGNSGGFATASSTKITDEDSYTDNDDWTFTNGYPADACVKFGGSSSAGSATSPSITVESGKTYKLSFKAAPWNAEASKTMTVTVTGGTINDKSSATTSSMTAGKWNDFEFDIVTSSTSLQLEFNCSANRFFLDEVKVTKPVSAATVQLNTSGYGTFCSVNPMDFTTTEGYTAWRISSIDMDGTKGTVNCVKITEAIKGGQGVLLYNKNAGGEKTNVTVTFANGMKVFDDDENLLVGTTAPTYVAANEYYGLKANEFLPVNPGTIPAGKALLPASYVDVSEVKAFTFVFEDETTGITETREVSREEVESIFNLGGQRLSKMQRGINIVNGKKVYVK